MRAVATLSLCGLMAFASLGASGQGTTGLQASWGDLETWARPVEGARESELGLGLHPPGGALVAFLGRLPLTDPRRVPSEIRIQVGAGHLSNPNTIRRASLTFLADADSKDRFALDLSTRLTVDDPAPGAIIQNGVASIRVPDFLRLTEAKTLTGNLLGFDTVFRPDQIVAMRAFAARLRLVTPN